MKTNTHGIRLTRLVHNRVNSNSKWHFEGTAMSGYRYIQASGDTPCPFNAGISYEQVMELDKNSHYSIEFIEIDELFLIKI
jgi:hypothetical protein